MLIDGEDAQGEFAGEIKHEIRTSLKREDVRR